MRYKGWFASIQPELGPAPGLGIISKAEAANTGGDVGIGGEWGLEAGSGPGFHAPGFARRLGALVVLDCSLANLVLADAVCRETGTQHVLLVRADVERLPIRGGSMAFVHENGVIEHVADPQKMVDEAVRVMADGATYVCLSPNRYPVTLEPHFRLPLFGLIPPSVRRILIPHTSGHTSETGTDLRSLRDLRSYFRTARVKPEVFFLPPRLQATVRDTPLRRAVMSIMARPATRAVLLTAVNRVLLPIAPYHFAVVTTRRSGDGRS